MTNCYKILGVKDFASPAETRTAYRKLSKKFHPDVNDGDKFFEERFKEIQSAYEILCDSCRKEIHDSKLKNTFTSSSNSDFKEKNKTESKEEGKADKTTNQHKQQAQKEEEQRTTNTQTSFNHTTKKPESKRFVSQLLGIFITLIIVIAIIALSTTKWKDTESYNTSYISNNQSNTPNYYSNQTTQTPTYQTPESNSNNNQNLNDDNNINQTYSTNDNYFSVGSTKNEVLKVQGNPTGINKYESMDEEVWSYGFSTVTFQNGRVNEYSNTSRNLKAKMTSSTHSQNITDYFTVGSSKDEVLMAQGNPTGINKYEQMGEEVWSYGFSTVTFQNGQVSEYSNTSRNLKAKMTTSSQTQMSVDYFSIGSTKDDVLQAQGDPTGINKYESMDEEVWNFGFSTVTFKSGRVSEYSNTSRNLKVRL